MDKLKDISLSPRNSTNGRFHALGFVKHYERGKFRPIHVWIRGNEIYRTVDVSTANKILDRLESGR